MLHVILTADPFLGKFDQLSLSDQALMELLVQCFDDKAQKRYRDQGGNFIDISEWAIVRCNDEGIVTYLDLPGPEYESGGYYTDDDYYYDSEDDYSEYASLAGSLETKYIPRQLATLEIQQCSLTGTFDVSALPATVEYLTIEDVERMHGTFDFGNLPECSKCVHIINSGFSGSVNLTYLPQSLSSLHISRTRFSGEVDLTKLPPKLEKLNLCENAFVGSVDLRALPETIIFLNIGANQLSGTLDVSMLPKSMRELCIYENDFSGVLDLNQVPETFFVRLEATTLLYQRRVALLNNADLQVITRKQS